MDCLVHICLCEDERSRQLCGKSVNIIEKGIEIIDQVYSLLAKELCDTLAFIHFITKKLLAEGINNVFPFKHQRMY